MLKIFFRKIKMI